MPQITLTIDDDKYENEFKPAFLAACPVLLDIDHNPIMADGAWIIYCIKQYAKDKYKAGKYKLATEQTEIQDIIS